MHITQARKTDLLPDVPMDSQRYMVGKQFETYINTAISRLLAAKCTLHKQENRLTR